MNPRLLVLFVSLSLGMAGPLRADTTVQVIAKARAYLGSESALNAVSTIHFTGILETTALVPAPGDKSKKVEEKLKLPADIVFQKDYQQRVTVSGPNVIETTALDGYDAWQKRSNPKNPAQWTVTLLDAGQVKKLRANTWENLSFFTGLEKKGGVVQFGGDAMADGVSCVKLSFVHADNIVFVRFFDRVTGRLVLTRTENGAEIREEGEIFVNGVRFPQKVINKAASGEITTITFDRVEVNQRLLPGEFAVPTLKAN